VILVSESCRVNRVIMESFQSSQQAKLNILNAALRQDIKTGPL
jgi:hypothetical protein